MNNPQSANTHIRTLYSPGFSSLMINFYKTNLTFIFTPFTGLDDTGRGQYDNKGFLSTSINYNGAAFFFLVTMTILNGTEGQIKAALPCNNNTTLTFEYKPDENNEMNAYLVIEKNNQTIPFKFPAHQYKIHTHGQLITKIIQSGLGTFVKTLDGYLTGVGADRHLNKLPENFDEYEDHRIRPSNFMGINGYQSPNGNF